MIVALGIIVLFPFGLQTPLTVASASTRYVVSFSATGVNFLGAGPDTIYPMSYTINFNGKTYSAPANQTIRVSVPAGSYEWSASSIQNALPCTECPAFWQASPGGGRISVGTHGIKSAHVTIAYVDEVSVSIQVPMSNGSSDAYPVTAVSTSPSFQNVTTTGQYWEASGYMPYGTAIQVTLTTNSQLTGYTFNQWGAMMVCTSTNRFAEDTTLYASDNCQFQALFNPSA